MSTYRVVFANGEKKELLVKADNFGERQSYMLFYKGEVQVAAVPADKVLYIEKVKR